MPSEIKCPNCGFHFNADQHIEAEISKKYEKEFQEKLNENIRQLEATRMKLEAEKATFEEKKKRENELFSEKLQNEKLKLQQEIDTQLRKSISADYDNQIKILQSNQKDAEEKLRQSREKELEFLKKEQELKNKEATLDIELQKKLQAERNVLITQLQQQEAEKTQLKETEFQLKLKALETQLEAQKKQAEEMQRRLEQGSMQLQGEVHELVLEQTLRSAYPYDSIEEVKKGSEGADCIQYVKNNIGAVCGKIIYESKNTKGWNNDWIEKLKKDMRSNGADVAIIVTKVFPKEMERFGEKEGVWICNFAEVVSVSSLIRDGIIKMAELSKSQENKGEKMQMLYNYLTGVEFKGHVEAIAEAFKSLHDGITKERVQMEKLWKEREKQLEKVLLNTSGMYGSVKGIAGSGVGHIPLLDGETDL